MLVLSRSGKIRGSLRNFSGFSGEVRIFFSPFAPVFVGAATVDVTVGSYYNRHDSFLNGIIIGRSRFAARSHKSIKSKIDVAENRKLVLENVLAVFSSFGV